MFGVSVLAAPLNGYFIGNDRFNYQIKSFCEMRLKRRPFRHFIHPADSKESAIGDAAWNGWQFYLKKQPATVFTGWRLSLRKLYGICFAVT